MLNQIRLSRLSENMFHARNEKINAWASKTITGDNRREILETTHGLIWNST